MRTLNIPAASITTNNPSSLKPSGMTNWSYSSPLTMHVARKIVSGHSPLPSILNTVLSTRKPRPVLNKSTALFTILAAVKLLL